jgi:HEAT repeat protein
MKKQKTTTIKSIPAVTYEQPTYIATALAGMCNTAISALTAAVCDPMHDTRAHAAMALGEVSETIQTIIPALIDALRDVDESVCFAAATALSRIGKPAVPALIKALHDENEEVRFYAVTALADLDEPSEEAIVHLIDVSCEGFPGIAWVAVEALQAIGTPEALRAIETYKEHESERYQPSHLHNEEA